MLIETVRRRSPNADPGGAEVVVCHSFVSRESKKGNVRGTTMVRRPTVISDSDQRLAWTPMAASWAQIDGKQNRGRNGDGRQHRRCHSNEKQQQQQQRRPALLLTKASQLDNAVGSALAETSQFDIK